MPDIQSFPDLISVQMAESLILRSSQRKYFSTELKILGEKGIFNRSSIYKLDPFLDRWLTESRWSNSEVYFKWGNETSSVVSKKKWNCSNYHAMRWCHEKVVHSGRVITMNYIRSSGFWIINCNATVRYYILKCATCRHLRGNLQ